jgi:catechol 2,3-dioxygenase-like lactoylglutathione lyase family enzyme
LARTAFVPVGDQDRALAFYAETLGFERGIDFSYAERRTLGRGAPAGWRRGTGALVAERDGATAGVDRCVSRCRLDDLEAVPRALPPGGA